MAHGAIKVYDTPEQNHSSTILPWILGLVVLALLAWGIVSYV